MFQIVERSVAETRVSKEGPRSLEHGLSILEAFTADTSDLGVSEVGRLLGLTKSTAHRLMITLVQRGYLVQDEATRKYRLSLRMYQVGSAALQRAGLHRVTFAVLEELGKRTGETVHLSVLSDGAVTYLHSVESTQPLRTYSRVGQRSPAHCTAMGKAMLAFLPEPARAGYLAGKLSPVTPNTIQDPSSFSREMESIRRQGYSLDKEEFQPGVKCIAVPVRDHTERVIAAVGLAAPAVRMHDDRLQALLPQVIDAAETISAGLGYRSSTPLRDQGSQAQSPGLAALQS